MNGNLDAATVMSRALSKVKTQNRVVICPPFTLLDKFNGINIGGQDCSAKISGAFTGEVSAAMLAEAGAKFVILGHSERRTMHNESSELVRAKCAAAASCGLTPIICVDESYSDQIPKSIPAGGAFIVAFEPVSAIGTGTTPSMEEIARAHSEIQGILEKLGHGLTPILYGGSVKGANANEIMSLKFVDGVLVGGASLRPDDFIPIINAI